LLDHADPWPKREGFYRPVHKKESAVKSDGEKKKRKPKLNSSHKEK